MNAPGTLESPDGGVVVDTDVLSLAFKGDTRAVRYEPYLRDRRVLLCFQSVGELERWAIEHRWGQRRREALRRMLARFTICHSSETLCRWWAVVMAGARRRGRRIEVADAWIAASALLYNVPLVTHNLSDYAGVDGLSLIGGDATGPSGAST